MLSTVHRFLDWLSEFDDDQSLKLIWNDSGGYLGFACPFAWDLRRPARKKTLIVMFFVVTLLSSFSFLLVMKIIKSLDIGVDVFCETIGLLVFSVIAFVPYPINIIVRRKLCPMIKMLHDSFKYDDFPDDSEERIRSRIDQVTKYNRLLCFLVYCFGLCMPILVSVDNNYREVEAFPDWFDKRLPIPIWLPFSTRNSVVFILTAAYMMINDLLVCQTLYGIINLNFNFCMRVVIELEVLIDALNKQENRSFNIYSTIISKRNNLDESQNQKSEINDKESRTASDPRKTEITNNKTIIDNNNIIRNKNVTLPTELETKETPNYILPKESNKEKLANKISPSKPKKARINNVGSVLPQNRTRTYSKRTLSHGVSELLQDPALIRLYELYRNLHFRQCYHTCFKKIIKHHKRMIEINRKFFEVAGLLYFFALYISGFLMASTIYSAFDERRTIAFRLFSVALTVNVFGFCSALCIIGEKVKASFSDIRFAIYSTQWTDADESIKRTIRIFLMRSQNPEELKCGITRTCLNHRFIFSMLRMCYSFVNLIRLLKKNGIIE